jgi:prephenate dehydrogenase
MTGNEGSGPLAADPGSIRGAAFLFAKVREDPIALDRARSLAGLVGARMVEVDADQHDAVLARTSHLAHVMAFALASLPDGESRAVPAVTSSGFATTTRLARSNPEMVAGFVHANGANVKHAVDELIAKLKQASGLLEQDPVAFRTLLETWQRRSVAPSPPVRANA